MIPFFDISEIRRKSIHLPRFIIYTYTYIYAYVHTYMHHNPSFNLFIFHNSSFDNQGSEIIKSDILRFDILSFMKTFFLLFIYTYISPINKYFSVLVLCHIVRISICISLFFTKWDFLSNIKWIDGLEAMCSDFKFYSL